MVEQSIPREQGKRPPSPLVDHRYAELIAEDLGCKVSTARTAFIGEPQKRALGVVAWAFKHEPDDLERRAKLVLAWAKKRKAGAFRDDEDAEREIARAISRYWVEHPDKLAEVLKAATGNGGGE